MRTVLPDGLSWRRPRLSDAESIADFVGAYNTAVVGFADVTLDDVRDELVEPGFDPERDGWLVRDGGRQVGYGWCFADGTRDRVDIEVVAHEPSVSDWLFAQTIGRAKEIAGAAGHPEVVLDKGIYRADSAMRSQLAAHGFAHATTFHRMRIDHTDPRPASAPDPPSAPEPPPGVVLTVGPGDDAFRRAGHAVMMSAFDGHFGFTPLPYEEWHEAREAQSTFDWSQLMVAALDGAPVGVLERSNQFVEDEHCGYVRWVGV
ncbi:MAG: GNAT family N-acetyltransferase, partial [Micromonosporaceae bacterium]|nr:GNAT family N-acetyltransferase [Micromonosporaceae bacterium]